MKANIDSIKKTIIDSASEYASSYEELRVVWNLYHNRQFSDEELNKIKMTNQPVQTFNIIKMYVRWLNGYYQTVLHNITTNNDHNKRCALKEAKIDQQKLCYLVQ